MPDVMTDVLRIVGQIAVRQIKARIREQRVSPKTNKAGTTLVKRGHLMNSIRNAARGSDVVITAGGANVPYARIMHEGGVIRAKRAKYLAIPLTPKAAMYKPRDYPAGEGGTFIREGVIYLNQGEGKKPLALYALKKQVVIPARPYMMLDDRDGAMIQAAVQARIERELETVKR